MRTDHRIRWTYSEGGSRHSEGGLTEEQALKLYRILNRALRCSLRGSNGSAQTATGSWSARETRRASFMLRQNTQENGDGLH